MSDFWPSFQNAILISELLDDHWDALKAKKSEVADLCWGMEELSVVRKAATEKISQLKVNLCHEVTARSSQDEELARRREELAQLGEELGKKGSEMLKKDSELQQRESALLAA